MNHKILLASILALGFVCGQSSAEQVVFCYHFDEAGGFTDGALAGQQGHVAQAQYMVDSTGTGTVTAASPGFQRFSAQGASDIIDWNALAVGDMDVLQMLSLIHI